MKTVYFNEYNVKMGKYSYLPFVSGLLRVYSETFNDICKSYKFMPFIYEMDSPDIILNKYSEPPDIAAFSSLMWNEQLNYHIASRIKNIYPSCIIVFGGPNVPMPPNHSVIEWMRNHEYVDVAVRAEGEETFADILHAILYNTSFSDIPGIAYKEKNKIIFNDFERKFNRDLSVIPSPYLSGMYDYLLEDGKDWQAIIETSRGCPFPCTFCYWGRGGLSRKYKYHLIDRVYKEIEWTAKNKIKYVFNADSNFGMNSRDYGIAEYIVEMKKKYGFPDKFRTCFGKNTDEKIFNTGLLLHNNKLEKGITLARQSNDFIVLDNIKRKNIKMDTYVNLQRMFNDKNIPVYAELILGLPGETKESWMFGVDELLEAGTKNQLYIYVCQVLKNTEMCEKSYREKFKIKTKKIELAEIHGMRRPSNWIREYEDIIISTYSMSVDEWKCMLKFSYVLMLFHSLKISYYIMIFILDRYNIKMSSFIKFISDKKFTCNSPLIEYELLSYDNIINGMLNDGNHRGTFLEEYGDIYWDVEESSFLRLTSKNNNYNVDLYDELFNLILNFFSMNDVIIDDINLLKEVIEYQKCRIPSQSQLDFNADYKKTIKFNYNLPEYFEHRFSNSPAKLRKQEQYMEVLYKFYDNDLKSFAKDTILWGRKSGTMLTDVIYY